MKSRRKTSKESVAWMEEFSSNYEKRGSSPRAHTVRTEMLKVGGPLHRCEDGSLFVLDEGTIFNWLKRRYTTQKSAGINLAVIAAAARARRQQQGGAVAETETEDGSGEGVVVAGNDDDEMDYERMRVPELKEQLRARGLQLSGLKVVLIQRLQAADAQQGQRQAPQASDEEEVENDNSTSDDDDEESDADESEGSCE